MFWPILISGRNPPDDGCMAAAETLHPERRGSQPQKEMIILAKTKKNRTDLAAERYSIPEDGAHAADTLINVLFDDLEPQDKLSLLWMGMGMAAVRKNDSQNNHDGVA